MDIVPLQIKEYAQHIVDYLNEKDVGKECVAYLQENILNQSFDPDVVVKLVFHGFYKMLENTARVSLSEYLVVMAANPSLRLYDMYDADSENDSEGDGIVVCKAGDFKVRWATDNDDNLDEWEAFDDGCDTKQRETFKNQLWEKADTLLLKYGPFSDKSDLNVIHEMVSDMQSTFLSLKESVSFPVYTTFEDVYEAGIPNFYSGEITKTYMQSLGFMFKSPQEAATTILNRPDVIIECGKNFAMRDETVSLKNKEYSYEELKNQTRDNMSNTFSLKRTRSWEDLFKAIKENTQLRTSVSDCLDVGMCVLKKGKKE